MTSERLGPVLRGKALFDLGAGLLLLTGTWDGLWDALDLPQGRPALFVQVGGAVLLALAYIQWRAAGDPALRAPVARGGLIGEILAALVIATWVVTDEAEEIGALGMTLLIVTAAALLVFAAIKLSVLRER